MPELIPGMNTYELNNLDRSSGVQRAGKLAPQGCSACQAALTDELKKSFANAAARTGTTAAVLIDSHLARFHRNGHKTRTAA